MQFRIWKHFSLSIEFTGGAYQSSLALDGCKNWLDIVGVGKNVTVGKNMGLTLMMVISNQRLIVINIKSLMKGCMHFAIRCLEPINIPIEVTLVVYVLWTKQQIRSIQKYVVCLWVCHGSVSCNHIKIKNILELS